MVNLVEWAAANISAMIPIEIIYSFSKGVEYRRGIVRRKQLEPGMYWRFPYFREIIDVDVNLQWIDLPFQRLVTLDLKTITCSATLGFRIYDAVIWHNDVQDAEDTLVNLARPIISKIIMQYDYDVLLDRMEGINRLVRAHMTKPLAELGASLENVGFTDFTEAKTYSIMGEDGIIIGD